MLLISEKCPSGKEKKPCRKKACSRSAEIPMPQTEESVTGRALLCRSCHEVITFEDEKTEINGSFTHSFTNPHGIFFDIGCYRNAPGCAGADEASSEFTWFRGFEWRVAVCRSCMNHVGWIFTSSATFFYGLIQDQLIDSESIIKPETG